VRTSALRRPGTRRRSFTAKFKAEIVELCQRRDRSIGQVSKDLGLTGTAVREWLKQAERDTCTRTGGGLTSEERRSWLSCAGEQKAPRGRGGPEAGDAFLREETR
jgi:transposase